MNKKPIFHALAASAYIVVVATFMSYGFKLIPHPNAFVVPIAMISLFTLSAAVMGYLFCYQPLVLYLEGKKKLATRFLFLTILAFGCLTIVALALLFLLPQN